ncbi:MAG: TraB/GumN family protein [Alphaproteobacteria bacterium]|nr:TraB/GumN family protein [Alphaproteobacteria bacterium]
MLGSLARGCAAALLVLGALAVPAWAEAPVTLDPPKDAPVTLPAPVGEPETIPLPGETVPKPGTPAIWHVTKPNGGTITLFGSVHLLPAGRDWHTPALNAALDQAETVVFETPLDAMNSPETMAYLQKHIMNPPGVTLSTLLSPEDKAVVEKAAGEVGAPFGMMEGFRPWFASLQLAVLYAVHDGFDPNSGVDKKVEADAKAKGKKLDYFETTQEQLDFFVTMPSAQELEFLLSTAKDILERPNELRDMVEAWFAGDVAKLSETINGGLEETPDIAKLILYDRNVRWVEKITSTYMADGNDYLIVVGAGHLIGDKGVPALLRAKGLKVEGP